jgi:hypothetical protein
MKKCFLGFIFLVGTLQAFEFKVGKGSYDTDFSVKSFLNYNTTHDTLVFTLSQPHTSIGESALFYYGDFEFLTSDTKNRSVEFANYDYPLIGRANDMVNNFMGMFPVDGDYEAIGFDIDMGAGYDVWREGESYLGIAINVGATLPTIDARDLSSKIDFVYDLIERWDLDLMTYKIGPSFKGAYMLAPEVSLYGSFSFGFQTGEVDSGLFKSSVDVDGDYNALDLGIKYKPNTAPYYVKLGYTRKHWNIDSVDVNLYNIFEADIFKPFDMELESSVVYLGMGYHF